jgi:hypothetical protein
MSSLLVFIKVYRLEIQYSQSCWYFRPSFVSYCPSNLLSIHLPPPFPESMKLKYIQTVCGWRGWRGVLSFVGNHILPEVNPLNVTRFRTYKIAVPLQTET